MNSVLATVIKVRVLVISQLKLNDLSDLIFSLNSYFTIFKPYSYELVYGKKKKYVCLSFL